MEDGWWSELRQITFFFMCGCLFMVVVPIAAYFLWMLKPRGRPKAASVLNAGDETTLPANIGDALRSIQEEARVETCLWLNCIVTFLFDEWRDSMDAKTLFIKKIQKEFDDLLSRTLGRVVKQLTVREYFLGTCLPNVKGIQIRDCKFLPNGGLKDINLLLEFEYNGGVQLNIDAELLLHKAALVTIRVCHAKGMIELKFTKEPFSHWSLSLLPDPPADVKLCVTAEVEGHNLNHLAKFIEMQIHRTIRKKHTLPSRKARFKPFLPCQVPYPRDTKIQYCGVPVTVGDLRVRLVDTEKLPQLASLSQIYCTVSVDPVKSKPIYSNSMLEWPTKEIKAGLSPARPDSVQDILDAELVDVYMTFEEERIRVSAVKSIKKGGLAWKYELQPGYILDCVNGKRGSCLQELDLCLSKLPVSEQLTVDFRFLKPHSSLELIPVSQDLTDSEHNLEATARKHKRQYQTNMKATSRYASWQMDCSFQVQPTDEFLNIYVWGEEQNNRTDVLLGRVSCKLSTVALSCLMTGGHRHEEKFHLTPSHFLRNVMKGKEQVVSDPTDLGLLPQNVRLPEELKSIGFFSGSVRLVCWYQHSHAEHRRSMCRLPIQDVASQKSEGTFSGEETGLPAQEIHEVCEMPGRVAEHRFTHVRISRDNVKRCSICQKKVKGDDVYRCAKCGLLCDQKCMIYCQKQVKCHRIIGDEAQGPRTLWENESNGPYESPGSHQDGPFQTMRNAVLDMQEHLICTEVAETLR